MPCEVPIDVFNDMSMWLLDFYNSCLFSLVAQRISKESFKVARVMRKKLTIDDKSRRRWRVLSGTMQNKPLILKAHVCGKTLKAQARNIGTGFQKQYRCTNR